MEKAQEAPRIDPGPMGIALAMVGKSVTIFIGPLVTAYLGRRRQTQSPGEAMKAIKATYVNGQITFSETPTVLGPVDVLVVFPEAEDDPWQAILAEQTPRP